MLKSARDWVLKTGMQSLGWLRSKPLTRPGNPADYLVVSLDTLSMSQNSGKRRVLEPKDLMMQSTLVWYGSLPRWVALKQVCPKRKSIHSNNQRPLLWCWRVHGGDLPVHRKLVLEDYQIPGSTTLQLF